MTRARWSSLRRLSTGQALAESLVAVLVLVPLWWFAAHWRTGFDTRVELLRQVRVAALAQSLSAAQQPAVPIGDVEIRRDGTPEPAGRLERVALALLVPATALAPGRPGFERHTWLAVTVRSAAPREGVPASSTSPWQETLQLLADDWSLAGPAAVAQRVDTLRPVTPADALVAALRPVAGALALIGADVRGTCARRIDAEIVPLDRRAGGDAGSDSRPVSRPASGWRPAC